MTGKATNHQVSDAKNASKQSSVNAGSETTAEGLELASIDGIVDVRSQVIAKPVAGETVEVTMEAGKTYVFDFAQAAVIAFAKDAKDLIVNFSDGASIALRDFAEATAGENPATLSFTDTLAEGELAGLIKVVEVELSAEELEALKAKKNHASKSGNIADIEPAAGEEAQPVEQAKTEAERAAEIEPAAGERGSSSASGASGHGYGFQSSFDPQGVLAIDDVGPINPTQLQYGFAAQNDDVFFEEQEAAALSPLNPVFRVGNQVVDEDNSVFVGIFAQPSSASGVLTIVISGIPAGWDVSGLGIFDPVAGTWTITTPAGATFNEGPIFSPPADSDVDLTALVLTVTETNSSTGQSASTSGLFDIIVDAVADVPDLAAQDASGEEGTIIPLDITTSVNDLDGSEVIEFVKISNLPAGTTLTAGTFDAVTNVWTLTPAQLAGLGINVPNGVTATFTLNVESIAFEQNTSDIEPDLLDNRASAFDTFQLHIKADDVPILVQPEKIIVDESDLAPVSIVSGLIEANFGADTPGSFSGNGTFFVGILTSGGVPVTVSFDPATNTYTGVAGVSPVFTLTIAANGSYSFTLQGVIDHPDTSDHNDFLSLEFGITASDSEGDTSNGVITVRVYDDGLVANDDYVQFVSTDVFVDGNVITNDDLSQDVPNTVTHISFGGATINIDPVTGADIDGQYGRLHINPDGTYTYTLFSGVTGSGSPSLPPSELAPVASDVTGLQNSITKDGITVSVANTGNFDLVWVTSPDGNGIGIDNLDTSDSKKILPRGETLNISFANDAQTASITIAEIGDNNDDGFHGVDYIITFADGTQLAGEKQFAPAQIINGHFEFTLNAADYGGKLISGVAINSLDSGNYLGASMLLGNVKATYPAGNDQLCDEFVYRLQDGDGDSDTAILKIKIDVPEDKLIVGQNVNDNANSTVPHLVGGDEGVIAGAAGNDILVGDAGGSFTVDQKQDYNFVFILDVSGSMGSIKDPNSKVSLLKDAVENLLTDASSYTDGEIKVHIVPFSTNAQPSGTFTLTDTNGLANVIAYIDSLKAGGYTNYEEPMQKAIEWLQSGQPLGGNAITTTYFISDGAPNHYIDASGNLAEGDAKKALGEVTGVDGSSEVALLQSLSDDLIAVGINVGATILRLNQIDSDGAALNIDDPADLTAVLASTNPITVLDAAGDDVLQGGQGGDIIFGDVLYTDDLAVFHGLTTENGSGWEVFERLENGQSAVDAGWDRADTIAYIRSNALALSEESTDSNGDGRNGGDDVISGGGGNDIIFGQEGDDIISGGAGNDVIYGGSGADKFLFETLSDALDVIKDFDITEGDLVDLSLILTSFDPLTDDIANFVIASESGGNTTLAVDVSGQAGISGAINLVTLEGVTGLDLDTAIKAVV